MSRTIFARRSASLSAVLRCWAARGLPIMGRSKHFKCPIISSKPPSFDFANASRRLWPACDNWSDVKLSGAKLSGVKLIGAELFDANLTGAYLSLADLSEALVSQSQLEWHAAAAP